MTDPSFLISEDLYWIEGSLIFVNNSDYAGNSALRPRRVDAELDPGGRGKELVGEGLNTLRARLATIRARLDVQN